MTDVIQRHWHSSNGAPVPIRSDSLGTASESGASSVGDDSSSPVRRIAVEIALDTIEQAVKIHSRYGRPTKHQQNMRVQVDAMLSKHRTLFQGMVRQLVNSMNGHCTADKMDLAIISVADEMFADNRRNWGRVVALYAFVSELCRQLVLNEHDQMRLAQTIGSYVSERLGQWIEHQGGWNAFLRHFPGDDDWEKTIFKGLLATGLGLGVLASLYALR